MKALMFNKSLIGDNKNVYIKYISKNLNKLTLSRVFEVKALGIGSVE